MIVVRLRAGQVKVAQVAAVSGYQVKMCPHELGTFHFLLYTVVVHHTTAAGFGH